MDHKVKNHWFRSKLYSQVIPNPGLKLFCGQLKDSYFVKNYSLILLQIFPFFKYIILANHMISDYARVMLKSCFKKAKIWN